MNRPCQRCTGDAHVVKSVRDVEYHLCDPCAHATVGCPICGDCVFEEECVEDEEMGDQICAWCGWSAMHPDVVKTSQVEERIRMATP